MTDMILKAKSSLARTGAITLIVLTGLLTACQPQQAEAPAATAASLPASPTVVQEEPGRTVTAVPQTELANPTPFPSGNTPTSPPPTETAVPAASTLPDPAGYAWEQVASGLNRPVDLTHAGDGSGRLFIVEQVGVIRILQDGQVLETSFLDLRDRVGAQSNEQGLLGLAFHPDYAANGYFFVNYTDFRGDTHLARFQRTEDPNRADPGSEMELLTVRQPYPNHNGGGLAFGPEGNLYAGLGDGGSAGDPQGNGQATDTLLGKVLRLDVNVRTVRHPGGQSLCNRRRPAGNLGIRPAQPLAPGL